MAFVTVGPFTLTTRDTAAVIWLAIGVAAILLMPGVRKSLAGAARSLLPFVLPLALFAGWMTLVIVLVNRLGVWNRSLLKETLIWFAVSGLALFFRFMRPTTEKRFFVHTALDVLRVGIFATVSCRLQSGCDGWRRPERRTSVGLRIGPRGGEMGDGARAVHDRRTISTEAGSSPTGPTTRGEAH